jgi:wobble nucleotide-excising tRNase
MIKKIISIKRTGKFADYSCKGDVSLKRLTLIYAENARGKTTLAAILRSLSDGQPDPITERCTLGQADQPSVELLIDTDKAVFSGSAWNRVYPPVTIFDSLFVHRNVYAGDAVDHEHRRGLYWFAIGEAGVKLAEQITTCDSQIDAVNPEIRATAAEIKRHILGQVSVDDFVTLKPIADVEQRITEKKKEIAALEKADAIASKPPLSPLDPPEIPFAPVGEVLAKTVADVVSGAEQKVRQHVHRCMDERGEAWIDQGMGYILDDRCPFCGQSITANDLIEAYRTYFSQAYASLKTTIDEAAKRVRQELSADMISRIRTTVESNGSRAEFWGEHAEVVAPGLDVEQCESTWRDAKDLLLQLLATKAASPLEVVALPKQFDEVKARCDQAGDAITKYNLLVQEANNRIQQKKSAVKAAVVEKARRDLETLENARRRFEGSAAELCTKYVELREKKSGLESQKKAARDKLEQHTSSFLQKYEQGIKGYLSKFGADFTIIEVGQSYPGGKPRLDYRLSIRSCPIELQPPAGSPPCPCFGNALGAGDKSALAFGFFLAALDRDVGLHEKVIVFDDPISSMDNHRRECTRQQILRLAKTARQVIVLSHDPYFLRMIWENSDKGTAKPLKIERAGDSSAIREWDVERDTQGEYFQNYFALSEYLELGPDGRDLRAVARCIRPLLEGNLRIRFPGSFPRNEWLGKMLETIGEAKVGEAVWALKPLLPELSEINDYSKQYHHDQTANADSTPITDTELSAYVQRTLTAVAGILAPQSQT